MKQRKPRYRSVEDLAPVDLEHHEVARSLSGWFARADFRQCYLAMYPDRAPGSILPSDYCFNRDNKGNPKHPRFLLWDGDRLYQFVGLSPAAPLPSGAPGQRAAPETSRKPNAAEAGSSRDETDGGPRARPLIDEQRLRDALLELHRHIEPEELFPTPDSAASGLIVEDPFAFALAACLDRGVLSEIIWTIPFDLKNALGHLDPTRLAAMKEVELGKVFATLPRKPRYLQDAPRTVREIATLVSVKYGGTPLQSGEGARHWRCARHFGASTAWGQASRTWPCS